DAALVGGSKTCPVTFNTPGYSTLTASDASDGTKTASTSPLVGVSGGAPARLTLQFQPSQTATAGVVFAQQPVVRVEDTNGNLILVDNGRVITATRATGSGSLQGAVTAVTTSGVASFTNLSYNVAETITINFAASGLTNALSSNVVVQAGAATRL